MTTYKQKARDLLEEAGVEDAQSMTAGDLAALTAERDELCKRVWLALGLGFADMRGPRTWEELRPCVEQFRDRVADAEQDVRDVKDELTAERDALADQLQRSGADYKAAIEMVAAERDEAREKLDGAEIRRAQAVEDLAAARAEVERLTWQRDEMARINMSDCARCESALKRVAELEADNAELEAALQMQREATQVYCDDYNSSCAARAAAHTQLAASEQRVAALTEAIRIHKRDAELSGFNPFDLVRIDHDLWSVLPQHGEKTWGSQ